MANDLLKTLFALEKNKDSEKIKEIINSHEYDADPAFQYFLAHLYYVGYIFEKSANEALEHLRLSALQEYASAYYWISLFYEKGEAVDVNLKSANEFLLKAAEKNYIPALNHLGEIYLVGRDDIKANEKLAFEQFEKCYNAGHLAGTLNYAYCLVNNIGCNGDVNTGLEILNKYAEANNADALYLLGKSYYLGIGVSKDHIKANFYLKRATEKRNKYAPKLLGDCYYDGIGVPIDHKLAYRYYKVAADLGNLEAAELVTRSNLFGDGVASNYQEAINYLVKSAEFGDADAQFRLAERYYSGLHFRKNYNRAFYWYQLAAKQNHPQANYMCGLMLEKGRGCKLDVAKAITYYLKAIELHYYSAAKPLADIYCNGKKQIKRNYELAVKYYEIAYLNDDDAEAAYQYAELVSKGRGVIAPDHPKAAKAYEFAAKHNLLPAIKKIGEYYLKGIGLNKDFECALRYYLIASKMGDEESTILVNLIRRSMEFK